MTYYAHTDASGNVLEILSDVRTDAKGNPRLDESGDPIAGDVIPQGSTPITFEQVQEWNRSRNPLKLENGSFVVNTNEVKRRQGEKLLTQFDREIEKADLKVAMLQMAWLTSQVLPLVDISSLPAPRQIRINTIIGRLDKLAAAFRAKKKAQTDLAGGTDPATIQIPTVDTMDD